MLLSIQKRECSEILVFVSNGLTGIKDVFLSVYFGKKINNLDGCVSIEILFDLQGLKIERKLLKSINLHINQELKKQN